MKTWATEYAEVRRDTNGKPQWINVYCTCGVVVPLTFPKFQGTCGHGHKFTGREWAQGTQPNNVTIDVIEAP